MGKSGAGQGGGTKGGHFCRYEVEGYPEVQGEVALVRVPEEEEGQEADLEVDLGEGQGVGLVVGLQAEVKVKVLAVPAFQVVSGM